MQVAGKKTKWIAFIFLLAAALYTIFPIAVVVMNSFKSRLFISNAPFALPDSQTFVGLTNYTQGLMKTGFFSAFGYSLWITLASVFFILLCTSMLAWYITRVHGKITSIIYYLLTFSDGVILPGVAIPEEEQIRSLDVDHAAREIEAIMLAEKCRAPLRLNYLKEDN